MKRLLLTFLLAFTFVSLIVEACTFKYFLFKHYHLSTDLLMAVSLFVNIIISNDDKPKNIILFYTLNLFLSISNLLFIPLSLAYFYLTYLNSTHYSNYVFSTYHLQPELILRPIVFSILLFSIAYIKNKKPLIIDTVNIFKNKKNRVNNTIIGLIAMLLVSFGLTNFFRDVATLTPYINPIVTRLNTNRNERYDYIMTLKYGSHYEYTKFIKSVVSEDSSILLPPQKNPWQYEGNQRLARYFLYPRTLYSSHEKDLPSDIDYIEIAWGSTDFIPKEGETYGWPKETIKSDSVYIYNFDTHDYKIYKGNYDPSKFLKPGVYGLIKIK